MLVPEKLALAVVCAEDHRFPFHLGVDFRSLLRILSRRVLRGAREGGSTIEQQVIRLLTGRFEKTLRRKLREQLLASTLGAFATKQEILAILVEQSYYGWRMNGIAQACQRLRLNLNCLSFDEAVGLAARLKYPEPRLMSASRRQRLLARESHLVGLIAAAEEANRW
jgi:membrane peptidoglycan carboxypeptidase